MAEPVPALALLSDADGALRVQLDALRSISRAERDIGIEIVEKSFKPGDVRRYATAGDGTTTDARWTGWEDAVEALLQRPEPFGKWVRFPAGRYGSSRAVETIGTCSIFGEGSGVTAIIQDDPDESIFKTTYRSAGHERVRLCDITLAGAGASSTVPAVNWVDTFHSCLDRVYITAFNVGWRMNTNAGGGNSSHSNSAYHSMIRGNYASNIDAGLESNALSLYSCNFGGQAGVATTYGIVFQDSSSLLVEGGGSEGCDKAAILIQGLTANVGASYDFRCKIHKAHFEAQVCDASDEGDIVIGLNGQTTILGVTVEDCFFFGNGSTYTPLNVIDGDNISYLRNGGHSSYANFKPVLPSGLTRYVQKGNFAGATAFPDYEIGSANLTIAKREQVNSGVNSVGGGHSDTGGTTSLTDNQTITVEIYSASLIQVQDLTGGNGALFFATFVSSSITELSDVSSVWSTTNTDTNPGWAIFKSASSQTVSIKNYMNGTRVLVVTILGACGGATAPA